VSSLISLLLADLSPNQSAATISGRCSQLFTTCILRVSPIETWSLRTCSSVNHLSLRLLILDLPLLLREGMEVANFSPSLVLRATWLPKSTRSLPTKDKLLTYSLLPSFYSSWSLDILPSSTLFHLTAFTSTFQVTELMSSGNLTRATSKVDSRKSSQTWLLACSSSFLANVLLWLMSLDTLGWRLDPWPLTKRSLLNSQSDVTLSGKSRRKREPKKNKLKQPDLPQPTLAPTVLSVGKVLSICVMKKERSRLWRQTYNAG